MRGTDATTGKALDGLDHLRQSIRDILCTPVGSRVMRREYGSELFQLVDAPLNRRTIGKLYAATVVALMRWEPRIRVRRVTAAQPSPGRVELSLEGVYAPTGQPVLVDGILI